MMYLKTLVAVMLATTVAGMAQSGPKGIGREVSIPYHLTEEDLQKRDIVELVRFGKRLFNANWTDQEGGGRPLMKGTSRSLADPSKPLSGMRAFNRVSAPDANSCLGCHNLPYGGGGGDFATNVFVLGQRFDFFTSDGDTRPTVSSADEQGRSVNMFSAGNIRASTGMFGAGYVEMLAREITAELQGQRDQIAVGQTRALASKGIWFGELTRGTDGLWDTSKVVGIPRQSLDAATPVDKPSLIIRPWHAAANAVSLREFSNNAFHQHHGIQPVERFGLDNDPDGDGVVNEISRADITAVSLYQAALPAPGRMIPRDADIEAAVLRGEAVFEKIGCSSCHVPELPLTKDGWTFTEPGPYNPPTNVRTGELPRVAMNLNSEKLPLPRLAPDTERTHLVYVPVYTDFKLHDVSDPGDAAAGEPLDQNETIWSPKFRKGNRLFLTKRLWGCANEPPYFHHGQFTTLRQAVMGHHGEALGSRQKFQLASTTDQDALIEFLKSLQTLPPGTTSLVVDENYLPRAWPPGAKPGK